MNAWQDDHYPGSCDYPGEYEAEGFDPWDDADYARAEDSE